MSCCLPQCRNTAEDDHVIRKTFQDLSDLLHLERVGQKNAMDRDGIRHIRQTSADVNDLGPEKAAYKNADKALEFLKHNKTGDERDAVDEKKLVKRIDWMMVPIMFACYFLQYLDKSLCK